jgi:hypothetical protein
VEQAEQEVVKMVEQDLQIVFQVVQCFMLEVELLEYQEELEDQVEVVQELLLEELILVEEEVVVILEYQEEVAVQES